MSKQAILCGDFLKLAPRLAKFSDFALISDPPFSPHVHAHATSCGTGDNSKIRTAGGYVGARHNDFGFAPLSGELRAAIAELGRRAQWIVLFSDVEGGQAWREALPRYIRTIPWIRWSMPQLSGDRPPQGCEYLIQGAGDDAAELDVAGAAEILLARGSAGGRLKYNGPGYLTHYNETCQRGKNKHKTAKPLDLCCHLVEHYSQPSQLVIDPCAGRGAIGLACKLLKRDYIGIEIDPTEAKLAGERLESAELVGDDARRWPLYQAARAVELEHMAKARAHTANVRARKEENASVSS
jgi:hypothetical protein